MDGVDVYDIDRDARTWPGGLPLVAHPPCRAWGRLRQFAKPRHDERELAILAVKHVREFGGVLEHPACSTLWRHQGLPIPGASSDAFGGFTVEVEQFHWGHKAQKKTWLYIVGLLPSELPPIPMRIGQPTHCITSTKAYLRLPTVTKREREITPPQFAEWLVRVASSSMKGLV